MEFASDHADDLAGKVVVDITGPVDWATSTPADSSAAEELAKRLPETPVVKPFNTVFAGTLSAREVTTAVVTTAAVPVTGVSGPRPPSDRPVPAHFMRAGR